MLKSLKFVQGAVARKDYVEALTCFQIKDSTIKGFNGAMCLCGPIDMTLDCTPKAKPFIKAIQTCEETVQLHMENPTKLAIKSGKFKVFVDCAEDETYPIIEPEGEVIELEDGFLEAIKTVSKFVAEDASRPWACGVLFRGPSAFATNNIVIVEYWLGYNFPVEINIPAAAVDELVRINEEPISLQLCESSITFHYSDGRWIRSQLLETKWPDIAAMLNRESEQKPLPKGLFPAAATLMPFADELGRVHLREGMLATHATDLEGATQEVEDITDAETSCFGFKHLMLLDGVATTIDLAAYPQPCMFFGDKIRGAIIGIR